ncbi:transcriptional regulator with XRE-family HTH domain [Pararhizobium capsulatum DSM 1112]|uniref:Transcriptional regulator with XRE-family HTH domain n=1 Tax=Pararhizobium capsulatum DSM 1112 TaxID=1121113 RepID=A0ABU0BX12_9HYPH|nr:XRE family transcriptional regulator [Pararhizobium capsulatum]MDQ0322487.1 transcriptional regulator with XRE-family HTH domain [Pararhizobium capsulatum DSM 1112]
MADEIALPRERDTALGDRLRDRRKALKLTLQEVADQAGFSVGFISQIERGITVPSLVSLVSVCRVLKIDVGSMFQQPKSEAPVTRSVGRTVYGLGTMTGRDVTYERLSAAFPGNVLRSTLIHEPPGYWSEPMSHEGEEIFYIVEGALTLELDGERMILETGDTAHFPSTRTHATWNHTNATTTVFHTCTMDVFGDGVPSGDPDNSLVVTRAADRRPSEKPKLNKGNTK